MKRVLVIDDEPQVRKMLGKLLEREGFDVTDAQDGREGIRLYHENPFDLVIMDLVMPEKEGIETIRELKGDYPEIKIIAMSGGGKSAPEGYLDMVRILGAMHTFAKPIMTDQLLDVVHEILGRE
ncbi:MAG: response regulator [Proteobacteria bacterium]|nr:response regulator [Pseudomonadota bacterium]